MITTVDFLRAMMGNLPQSPVPNDGVNVAPIGKYGSSNLGGFVIFADVKILEEGVDNLCDIIIRTPKAGFQGAHRNYLENILNYNDSYFDLIIDGEVYSTNSFAINIRNSQSDEMQREILVCSVRLNFNKKIKQEVTNGKYNKCR